MSRARKDVVLLLIAGGGGSGAWCGAFGVRVNAAGSWARMASGTVDWLRTVVSAPLGDASRSSDPFTLSSSLRSTVISSSFCVEALGTWATDSGASSISSSLISSVISSSFLLIASPFTGSISGSSVFAGCCCSK